MCTDQISNILSLIAIVVSIVAFHRSNPLQKGQVEMQIRELISNARYRYLDISSRINIKEEEEENVILKNGSEALLEDLLNAYDEACAKYIDNKVDKKRFKKIYDVEIRQLYEENSLEDKFQKQTTRFQAIRKVYNEWNTKE